MAEENKDGYVNLNVLSSVRSQLDLYGIVGRDYFGDGFTAIQVVDLIKKIPQGTKELVLNINSPGGSVTEGIAIYNRLSNLKSKMKITANIDALSASIATVIMLAADTIEMGDAGFVMIHKPWTYQAGNSDELEKTISVLNDIESQMTNLYMRKTKMSYTEIKKMLSDETWMGPKEALELGFIDSIKESEIKVAAMAYEKATWFKIKNKSVTTENQIAKHNLNAVSNKINNYLAHLKK